MPRAEVGRIAVVAVSSLVLAASVTAADTKPKSKQRPSKQYTIEQFMSTVNVMAWSLLVKAKLLNGSVTAV